jgi:hypothetical protein
LGAGKMTQIKLDDVKVKENQSGNGRSPEKESKKDPLRENLGTRRVPKLRMEDYPNAYFILREGLLK